MNRHSLLSACVSDQALVRLVRSGREAPGAHASGVPVAVGRAWVVIARLSDDVRIDGFEAQRIADLSQIERKFRGRAFFIRALRVKQAHLPSAVGLATHSTRALLESARRLFPLVGVYREPGTAGVDIGRIVDLSPAGFRMRVLNPNAEFDDRVDRFKYADITRVIFGGEYENTLARVAAIPFPRWE